MLNISKNENIAPHNLREFVADMTQVMPKSNRLFRNWLMVSMLIVFVFLFLPWTQNIQSNGKVTTLLPEDRPQTIQSAIAGRVEKWYVREGQSVKAGDTIVQLAEIKAEYLDPQLVGRTAAQRDAKIGSADSYLDKAAALSAQIQTLEDQLILKREQIDQKIKQTALKINTQQANIANEETQLVIAQIQYNRSDSLYQLGIDARTKLEDRTNKLRATEAKLTTEKNKLAELLNELDIMRIERRNVGNETMEKITKSRSERATAISNYYASRGDMEKLENQLESYTRRAQFYHVIAPQDGIISVAFVPGVGETIKEGDPVVSIVSVGQPLAVELFLQPMDLPLIKLGQDVRLLFDGWPAIVFGGWPGMSFGTFFGEIVAVDNNTDMEGKYRILVAPPDDQPWPEQLRPGGGARGITLLSNVPLWYEIWRQLNGFPPDYYLPEGAQAKTEDKKDKAPVRSVIK